MNDLVGADVVDLIDMKYNPKEEMADGTKRPDKKPAPKPEVPKSAEERLAELNFAEKMNAEARSAQNQMNNSLRTD